MTSDTVLAVPEPGAWEFDQEVTDAFEDMLRRAIPQYDVMRQAVRDVALAYAKPGSWVVDLGCSRGDNIALLLAERWFRLRYLGVDVSEPMLAAAQSRFEPWIAAGNVEIRHLDLRRDFPEVSASVYLAVLTLQFVPLEYRPRVIQDCYDRLPIGGALVVVEKVLGAWGGIDDFFTEAYYRLRGVAGYSPEEVMRKRAALEGVMAPVSAEANILMLERAGFRRVDCFWRWMNFAAFVAEK